MSDVRNYEEYRAQALASLGEDYTVEDLRNEERFRSKVLDGLGVSYETDDLVNFEKYRIKVLQGIAGGGGGGSSDFSTAEMTIVGSTVNMNCAYITEYSGMEFISIGSSFHTGQYTIPLYKGMAVAQLDSRQIGVAIATGNATIDEEGVIIITGDCTITIS